MADITTSDDEEFDMTCQQLANSIILLGMDIVMNDDSHDTAINDQRPAPGNTTKPRGRGDGDSVVRSFLAYSDARFQKDFRITKHNFFQLYRWLKCHTALSDSRHHCAEYQLLVFIWILAHSASYRSTAMAFKTSSASVHRIYNRLLPMVVRFKAFVVPPDQDGLDSKVDLGRISKFFDMRTAKNATSQPTD